MSFSRKILHTSVFKLLQIVISLGTSIIIARSLGPYFKGIFTSILLLLSIIILLGTFGVEISNLYFTAKHRKKSSIYFSSSIVLSISFSLLLFPVAFLFFHLFKGKWLSNIDFKYLLLSMFLIPTGLLNKFLSGILLGYNEVEKNNLVNFYKPFFYFVFVVILLFFFKIRIEYLIIALILSDLLSIFILIYYLRDLFKIKFRFNKTNIKEFKRTFLYGFKGYLSNVFSFINYRIDSFIIMRYLTPDLLGIYSITTLIAEKIGILPNLLAYVLLPHIATYNDRSISPRVTRFTFAVMCFILIVLVFALKPLIVLIYGKSYGGAYYPFLYLLPGILFLSVGKVIASDIIGRGYTTYTLIASATSAIVNIVLNVILIPTLKLNGAALASSISYSLNTFILIFFYIKLTHINLKDIFIIQREDIIFMKSYLRNVLKKGNRNEDRKNK